MVLEIGFVCESELGGLVNAVVIPAAHDAVNEGHVEVEAERGRSKKPVGVGSWLRGMREKHWERVGGVVGKVDETLP